MRRKRIFIDLHCPKCKHTKPFRVVGTTLMALDVRCVGCDRPEQVAPITPEEEARERVNVALGDRFGFKVVLDPAIPPDRLAAVFVQDGKVVGAIQNSGAPQEGA